MTTTIASLPVRTFRREQYKDIIEIYLGDKYLGAVIRNDNGWSYGDAPRKYFVVAVADCLRIHGYIKGNRFVEELVRGKE